MIRLLSYTILSIVILTTSSINFSQQSVNPTSKLDSIYASGEDVYLSGGEVEEAFAIGEDVTLARKVTNSAHLIGKNIQVTSSVGNNLYVVAQNIEVLAPIGGNVNLIGQEIFLNAAVQRNVRLIGQNIDIQIPVKGDLMAAGESIYISKEVLGDVRVTAENLEFGDQAVIRGSLYLSGSGDHGYNIPEGVISSDRIFYENYSDGEYLVEKEFTTHSHGSNIFMGIFFSILVLLALVLLASNRVNLAYAASKDAFWTTTWHGVIAFALLCGLTLVSAITVIGIPVAIIITLGGLILLGLGYLLGSYLIVQRLVEKFQGQPLTSTLGIIAVVVVAVGVSEIANEIPVFGWLLVLILLFYGLGSVTPWRISQYQALMPSNSKENDKEPASQAVETNSAESKVSQDSSETKKDDAS